MCLGTSSPTLHEKSKQEEKESKHHIILSLKYLSFAVTYVRLKAALMSKPSTAQDSERMQEAKLLAEMM